MTNETVVSTPSSQAPESSNTPFWDNPANLIQPGEARWEDDSAGDDDSEAGNDAGQETPASGTPNPENKSTDQKAGEPDLSDVKDKDVRDLMREEAAKRGLNLNDPREREFARAFAEAQNQIRTLKLKAEPSAPAKSYLNTVLSKFDEKPAGATEQPVKPAEQATAPSAPQMPAFVQMADKWQKPEDFTEELLSAYESQDKGRIATAYMGFHHKMMADYMPLLQQQIAEAVTQRLGPLAQEAEVMQSYQVNNQVLEVMKSAPEFADIERIFENASGGQVELNGNKVPDTWLNRILANNPMIELIEVKGKTPAETDRKTRAARYAAVFEEFQRMRNGSIDSSKASQLVEAGRTAEKNRRDPVRQGLNSGRTGVPSGAKPGGAVKDIVGYSDGSMSTNDLFS